MTKAQLIKALENYGDDTQVHFTLPGAEHIFYIDKVNHTPTGVPVLECEDAPTFDDVCGMADACFIDHKNNLNVAQIDILANISTESNRYLNGGAYYD